MGRVMEIINDLSGLIVIGLMCLIVVGLSADNVQKIEAWFKKLLNRNKKLKDERAEIDKKSDDARTKVEEDLKNASDKDIIDQFHDAFGHGIPDGTDKPDGSGGPDRQKP